MAERRNLVDLLLGRPLRSAEEARERIGMLAGVALLGLDALSSAAYGPEAALTVLRPLGPLGGALLLPITLVLVCLLVLVACSYQQTLAAYPNGGGSYTVARQNLGPRAGLFAAAALMLDYLLNVAVGISAGVGAVVSAVPALRAHTLSLCLGLLLLLTLVNLRGVREAGAAFLLPTYLFIGTLLLILGMGLVKWVTHGGTPLPVDAPPPAPSATAPLGAWLVLRAFASGCTAMTGVEAISNAVPVFRGPSVRHARATLAFIVGVLVTLLLGISVLCRAYGITATEPGGPGYESVLSQLTAAVAGRGVLYYATIGIILVVLALSANTSFADFPRVCHLLSQDHYLPHAFSRRGRRLAFSHGIFVLSSLSAGLLILCGGVTDRLIPLFAIGAFLAFTLSQAGMVVHWRRTRPQAQARRTLNGLGATATGLTLGIVLVSKFLHGGWAALVLILLGVLLFSRIHANYERTGRELALARPVQLDGVAPPLVIVPVAEWSRPAETALAFALRISPDVRAVHVHTEEEDDALVHQWERFVEQPLSARGIPVPRLEFLTSPYRELFAPLKGYVERLLREEPQRTVAVVLPELLEPRWYRTILHGRRAEALRSFLLLSGEPRLIVVSVPWFLRPA